MEQKNQKKAIGAIAAIAVVAVVAVAAWGLSSDPAADAVLDGVTSAEVVAGEADASSAPVKPAKDADKKDKDEKASEDAEEREGEEAVDAEGESEEQPGETVEYEVQQDEGGQSDNGSTRNGNGTVGGGDPNPGKQSQSGSTKPTQEQTKPSNDSAADSGKTNDSGNDKPASQDTRKKVWVEPVYEDVYHEEVGHWETKTRTVTKVICGGTDHNPGDPNYDGPFGGPSPIFDDVAGWKAHQEAFIAEMRKDDPYYQCTGRHRPAKEIQVEESYDEWVVDEEAWTEQVLVSEGYWDYE